MRDWEAMQTWCGEWWAHPGVADMGIKRAHRTAEIDRAVEAEADRRLHDAGYYVVYGVPEMSERAAQMMALSEKPRLGVRQATDLHLMSLEAAGVIETGWQDFRIRERRELALAHEALTGTLERTMEDPQSLGGRLREALEEQRGEIDAAAKEVAQERRRADTRAARRRAAAPPKTSARPSIARSGRPRLKTGPSSSSAARATCAAAWRRSSSASR